MYGLPINYGHDFEIHGWHAYPDKAMPDVGPPSYVCKYPGR